MTQGDDSSPSSAARAQTEIGRSQHGVFLAGSGPGTLREDATEPIVAAARANRFAHPGAFVIARTDSGLGG